METYDGSVCCTAQALVSGPLSRLLGDEVCVCVPAALPIIRVTCVHVCMHVPVGVCVRVREHACVIECLCVLGGGGAVGLVWVCVCEVCVCEVCV